jgi:hypothetical protein
MEAKNIYQRINAVMNECDYLQKKQAQQGKGIKYDEVMAMIRELLIKHGIVMVVRQTEMSLPSGVEGTKQKVYQGRYEMDLVNMDNPTEVVTHSAYAHGMDGGDKAPGKAHTYAVKIMLVKGFGIETGEDEESRAEKIEKLNTISEEEQDSLAKLIDGDAKLWKSLCNAYKVSHLNQIRSKQLGDVKSRIEKCRTGERRMASVKIRMDNGQQVQRRDSWRPRQGKESLYAAIGLGNPNGRKGRYLLKRIYGVGNSNRTASKGNV